MVKGGSGIDIRRNGNKFTGGGGGEFVSEEESLTHR